MERVSDGADWQEQRQKKDLGHYIKPSEAISSTPYKDNNRPDDQCGIAEPFMWTRWQSDDSITLE